MTAITATVPQTREVRCACGLQSPDTWSAGGEAHHTRRVCARVIDKSGRLRRMAEVQAARAVKK